MLKFWTVLAFLVALRAEANATCAFGDVYECVGNFHSRSCDLNDDQELLDYKLMGGTGPVCYPGYSIFELDMHMFQPKPVCAAEGQFSLYNTTNRCNLYYTCASTGRSGEYNFVINSCGTQEFSPWAKKCMPNATAGCSVITTTPIPTTTQTPCTKGSKRADIHDCKKFYDCTDPGVELLVKCPFEFYFDSITSTCGSNNTVCGIRPFTTKAAGDEELVYDETEAPQSAGPMSFFFNY